MNIKKGDAVTLSNNIKYLVLSKVLYNDKYYLYMTSIEDKPKIKICVENKNGDSIKLEEVKDTDLIKILILLFSEDIKSFYSEWEWLS